MIAELGPGPASARRRSRAGLAPDPPGDPADRRAVDGPDDPVRRGQRVPGRGAVPQPGQSAPAGQPAEPAELAGDLGRPGDPDAGGRTRQPDRHRSARAHAGGDGPSAARRRSRRRGLRLPPGRACRAGSAGPRCGPRCWPGATSSGAAAASGGADAGGAAALPVRGGRGDGWAQAGQIESATARPGGPAYLVGGGHWSMRPSAGVRSHWSATDRDRGRRRGGAARPPRQRREPSRVRHSFAAGWGVRLVLANRRQRSDCPGRAAGLGSRARLPGLGAAGGCHRWVRGAGSGRRRAAARRRADSGLLRARSTRSGSGWAGSSCRPLGRYVVQWQWDWYPSPARVRAGTISERAAAARAARRRDRPDRGRRRRGGGRPGRRPRPRRRRAGAGRDRSGSGAGPGELGPRRHRVRPHWVGSGRGGAGGDRR